MRKALVIGYGNTLRSDDGVGVWIADHLADLHLPEVDVRTCHQLFPELAADFQSYDRVIMIDASADGEPLTVRKSIPPLERLPSSNHNVTPELLQQIALEMFAIQVNLSVYTVRGETFEFGTTLSPKVKERATKTVDLIAAFFQQTHQKEMNTSFILN
jgi:hydrogenase maturation protease